LTLRFTHESPAEYLEQLEAMLEVAKRVLGSAPGAGAAEAETVP
jgi:hypothetical protein